MNQRQHFYEASRRLGEANETFMELVNHPTNPLTREDLEANIKRRPALWSRYAGFLDKLLSRSGV
jgi:hypothetical protein